MHRDVSYQTGTERQRARSWKLADRESRGRLWFQAETRLLHRNERQLHARREDILPKIVRPRESA